MHFLETYNSCLQILREYELVGDISFKARIKDFSSAHNNTEHKALDDIFGMQIATPNELEKELIILFNELIFSHKLSKVYNKPNGYNAFHCTGDVSKNNLEQNNLRETLLKLINNTEVECWTSSEKEESTQVPLFRKLKILLEENEKFDDIVQAFEEMIKELKESNINFSELPVIETHCLTKAVEEESIRGSCSHVSYKRNNKQDLIRQFFQQGKLIYPINAPWKFVGDENGVRLQKVYDGLLESWPFLRDLIVAERKQQGNNREEIVNRRMNEYLAAIFPSFSKYFTGEECKPCEVKDLERLLERFKSTMVLLRIDYRNEPTNPMDDLGR